MSADYIALAVLAVVVIGGGLFLLAEAKRYRARQESKASPHRIAH